MMRQIGAAQRIGRLLVTLTFSAKNGGVRAFTASLIN